MVPDSGAIARGREASTLRKGLLAVLLVGASFAGGAAVNGVGNGWIRSLIQGPAPPEAVAVAVDGGEDPTRGDDAPSDGVPPPAQPVPAAAPPALVPDPLPPAAPPRRDDPPPAPTPLEAPAPGPMLGPGPLAATNPPDPEAPGLLDLQAPRADAPGDPGRSLPPAPRDVPAPPPPAEPPQAIGWADAPGSAPAAAALTRPAGGEDPPRLDLILASAATAPGPPDPDARPAGVWAALRRRMRELGVARYWIEGEPAGAVRFRCVVPLAGARAVGQLFEAEADDDIQAAEAALRRVALWRATETP